MSPLVASYDGFGTFLIVMAVIGTAYAIAWFVVNVLPDWFHR